MSSTSARNSPQVPHAPGDTQYNVHNAALRGASSAFFKPPLKPKPQPNTYTGGNNGALLAAAKVGTGTPRAQTPSGNTSPLRRNWTGGSTRTSAVPPPALSHSSSSSTLAVPDDGLPEPGTSPSNIAARLAAARYSPMKQPAHTPAVDMVYEGEAEHSNVHPPAGSVGRVLARLDSSKPKPKSRELMDTANAHSSTTGPVRLQRNNSNPTDETPIPPTISLVSMFEQKPSTTSQSRPLTPSAAQPAPPVVRSPKPRRAFQIPSEPQDDMPQQPAKSLDPPPMKPKPRLNTSLASDGVEENTSFGTLRRNSLGPTTKHNPTRATIIKNPTERPTPPPKRGSRQTLPKSEDLSHSPSLQARRTLSSSLSNHDIPSSPSSFVSAREQQDEEKPKPSAPPPRRSARPKSEAKTNTQPKSAGALSPKPTSAPKMPPSLPPSQTLAPPRRASMSGSSTLVKGTLYHNNYQRGSALAITKHMTGEDLSSAIVGAALASSRNASPAPASTATPPLPARSKQHHHHSLFHRSPSPPKPQPTGKLRPTMRREPSSSSDEDESEKYKRKGTRIMGMGRKHPNKHHEGTRKRWRDQVTERERKRYEGVWAANKGLYIPHAKPSPSASPSRYVEDDPSYEVLNLVTKEIWERSRLPQHVLEEVWDLVDGRGVGRLRREEFVVGLWLVDQRLKGRKLPPRVSESVWTSVKGAGVKVKVGPRR